VARGLRLRHDHGSNYMSGDFQDEIECLGIEAFTRAGKLRRLPSCCSSLFLPNGCEVRRPITETDGTIVKDLKHLVEPVTMGDPMRPLGIK
jgi:hypothetical protein